MTRRLIISLDSVTDARLMQLAQQQAVAQADIIRIAIRAAWAAAVRAGVFQPAPGTVSGIPRNRTRRRKEGRSGQ